MIDRPKKFISGMFRNRFKKASMSYTEIINNLAPNLAVYGSFCFDYDINGETAGVQWWLMFFFS